MSELVFVKLGGSLLTDKTRPEALRPQVLQRLAAEMAGALAEDPGLRLVIGHGSGSFGHLPARKYGTRQGVATPEEWLGYAETAAAAGRLNRRVVDALWGAGVPALSLQPSASAHCNGGELLELDLRPLHAALAHGLSPVVYGDVALDKAQGGTIISTEQIFRWLAPRLRPARIVLVGEVEGVLSADPASGRTGELIPEITPDNFEQWQEALGGSRGIDVTGGMLSKVKEMLALVEEVAELGSVQLISGLCPDLLRSVLGRPDCVAGTRIRLAQSH